ncbi:hypothetical protein [Niabella ginsenosidivorans]|nr:hypothetical protein [Niabella ginsenosidivorans]
MQSVITWEQLLIYLFIFLIIYYAVVLALFYRHDLVKLGNRFTKQELADAGYLTEESASSNEGSDYDALYNNVHELMKDCKDIFINVTNAPIDKARLIADLNQKVKSYPQIKGTAFQISMSNHIAQEASHRLGIELENDELEQIWQ